MSLEAIIAASFVGIGVLVALYAERRVPKPSPVELAANIWEAGGYFAALEIKRDSGFYRLGGWLDLAGLRGLQVLEFLGLTAGAAIVAFLVAQLVFGGYLLSVELALAGATTASNQRLGTNDA